MNMDLILIYAVFVYILITGMMLFWLKTDVINKLKAFLWAPKGAKLFRLYRKDGTSEDFVQCAKNGGTIEHDGDNYIIQQGSIMIDRAKNAPLVTLLEGDVPSVKPFDEQRPRVDTKELKSLFFAEREKAKTDVQPDFKALRMIVIIVGLVSAITLILAWFNYQNTEAMMAAIAALRTTGQTAAEVIL